MKTLQTRWYRMVAVLAFTAFGIVTTIATGGGGGGGGSITPPPDTGPTLTITVDNGEAVSTATITGVMMMFDVSEISDPLLASTDDATLMLQKAGSEESRSEVPFSDVVEFCAAGGTITLSGDVADPNTLTVGDTITALFENCDDNEGYVINGGIELTIAAIEGDPLTNVFLVTLDMVLTGLVVTDDSGAATADGDLTLTVDSLDFPVILTALSGSELMLSETGLSVTFEDYDHTLTVDTGVVPQTFLAEVFGRMGSSALAGTVDYETVVPIQATGDNPPYTGEILITGADDSRVRIVIVSEGVVRLEIDEDGDGVVDEFVDTTWDALEGETTG
ncbi:hypothetical protein [Lentisalinibacter salinarum]|uniref:hypothetical protein n=1 Tax=Lentisalinibacter salinarum TaxID=2992239 RepID=UPI00386DAD22